MSLIRKNDINLVLDVGANVGQFATSLRSLGYAGAIHSFEPNPDCFSLLARYAARDKNWHCSPIALSSTSGYATLTLPTATEFSSMRRLGPNGKVMFPGAAAKREISVSTARADELLADIDRKNARVLLKIDTQGFDLEVFEGAVKLGTCIKVVVSELSFIPIYEDSPSWATSLATFERHGFKLSGLYPVSRTNAFELIEGDAVFCRGT